MKATCSYEVADRMAQEKNIKQKHMKLKEELKEQVKGTVKKAT